MGKVGLCAVKPGVHRLWFNGFQDAGDLRGELHLTEAWHARHKGQGLAVAGHGQGGLKHQGRGQTQGFQGPKAFQLPAWDINTRSS